MGQGRGGGRGGTAQYGNYMLVLFNFRILLLLICPESSVTVT